MSFLKSLFKLGKDERYEKAMLFYNRHQYKEAIELFEETLQHNPSPQNLYHNLATFYSGQAHLNLGIILLATGNYSTALREFQASLHFGREHSDVFYFMGICQNNLGDFSDAIASFDNALEIDPSRLSIRLKMGIALHNLKMWAKAESIYRNVLHDKPDYADVHFRLGLALLGQGRAAEAGACFESALAINPAYTEARKKLAITQAYLGDFTSAIDNFQSIIAQNPGYADLYYYLGIACTGRAALGDAAAAFKQALDINPGYIDARIKLGILYCRLERFPEALTQLTEASSLTPDNRELKTVLKIIQGKISTMECSPEDLQNILGQLFGADKPLTQTIQEFNRHIEITPDFSAIVPIIKHFSDEDTSLCKAIVPLISDYVKTNPNYPDLHNTRGSLYLKLQQLQEAEACFREAVRLNPEYVDARINLLKTLKKLGKVSEALEHGEYFRDRQINYPDVQCALGELFLDLGRNDDALACAEIALAANGEYGQAYFLKALVYAKEGRHEETIEALKHCLCRKISNDLHAKAQKALDNLTAT